MTWVAALAPTANVMSALVLFRFREVDANARSVWICSRNDAIGNVAVVGAAGGLADGWRLARCDRGGGLGWTVPARGGGHRWPRRAEIRALEIAAAEPAAKPDAA